MKYQFYQVDVFTDTPFGGNPLAVFISNHGLTHDTMQKIAKEMNLSETTFICSAEKLPADFSIRIFTPEKELPFLPTHPWMKPHHKEFFLERFLQPPQYQPHQLLKP